MKYWVFPLFIALTGCASFSTETKAEEIAWQILHLTDVVQTYHGPVTRPQCFHEQGTYGILPLHPTTAQLSAWYVGTGAIHFGVTKLMKDHNVNSWIVRAWELVTITDTGITVSNNYKMLRDTPCP